MLRVCDLTQLASTIGFNTAKRDLCDGSMKAKDPHVYVCFTCNCMVGKSRGSLKYISVIGLHST